MEMGPKFMFSHLKPTAPPNHPWGLQSPPPKKKENRKGEGRERRGQEDRVGFSVTGTHDHLVESCFWSHQSPGLTMNGGGTSTS